MVLVLEKVISTTAVDLDDLDALFNFLYIGLSFQSTFQLIKGVSASKISQTEAQALKTKLKAFTQNKLKDNVRARIPGVLIGILEYAVNRGNSVSERVAQETFKQYLGQLDAITFDRAQCEVLLRICGAQGLGLPYYTTFLNAKLDAFAMFFNGNTPNAFSNARNEFSALLRSRLESLSATPILFPTTPSAPPTAPTTALSDPATPSAPPTAPTTVLSEPATPSALATQERPIFRVKPSSPTEDTPSVTSTPSASSEQLALQKTISDLKSDIVRERAFCVQQTKSTKIKYGLGGVLLGCVVTYLLIRKS